MKNINLLSTIILTTMLLSCQTDTNKSKDSKMDKETKEKIQSGENEHNEIVKLHDEYISSWERGEGEVAMGFWAENIVMYTPGSNPHSGIYRGKAEVKKNLIDRIYAETSKAEVLGLIDRAVGRDHVFTIVHERFTKADGRVFETQRVVIYRWSNKKVVEVRYFDLDQKAADVFWSK